jgi:tyrosinase
MAVIQTRRSFLQRLASGTLALGLGGLPASCGWFEKIKNRPTRRNIATLPSNDPIIQTYRAAVTAMQALPAGDGRNWTKQAQIHLNHCPHGNWYFLPWHRAYLFYFEEICRTLTGNDDFALPYWNWTSSPSIPAPFWSGSLLNTTRVATSTSQASAGSVGATVMNNILSQPNFLLFASGMATGQRDFSSYGQLEGTPHNYIHGFVGGNMGTYMSPLDPVFWCHHNMIDCCWVDWNIVRGHPSTNDPQWVDFEFVGNFVDGGGSPVNIKVAPTLLMPLLSYQYDSCAPPTGTSNDELQAFVKRGARVRLEYLDRAPLRGHVELAVGRPSTLTIPARPERLTSAARATGQEQVVLTVGEVTLPRNGDFYVDVFINRPDAGPTTPETDPHFAGSFAFFVDAEHQHAGSRPAFVLDVTEAVSRLSAANGFVAGQPITVQLVPVPIHPERPVTEGTFSLESLELSVVRAGPPAERHGAAGDSVR